MGDLIAFAESRLADLIGGVFIGIGALAGLSATMDLVSRVYRSWRRGTRDRDPVPGN